MQNRRWLIGGVLLGIGVCGLGVGLREAEAQAGRVRTIVVSDAPGLEDALVDGNRGRRIRLLPGSYPVQSPLVVPDGVTLEGPGVMQKDPEGFPAGFDPTKVARIVAASNFVGDLLTLGDGAAIRGLVVEDIDLPLRQGNGVVVRSRELGDSVAASIVECEINVPGSPRLGPLNYPVVFINRHEGSAITGRVERSIVRSGGSGLFTVNTASGSGVRVFLDGNTFDSSLQVAGGHDILAHVEDTQIDVHSTQNRYRAPVVATGTGWNITAGTQAPGPGLGASRTRVRVRSINDSIVGFAFGVRAVGASRLSAMTVADAYSGNTVELTLLGLTLDSMLADLVLIGALSSGNFLTGDDNVVRVFPLGVTGNAILPLGNVYANVIGPTDPANLGSGNQVKILLTPKAFERLNDLPLPPEEFLIGGR